MTDERKYSLMMAGLILATAAALTAFSFLGWHSGRSASPVEQAGVGGSGAVEPASGLRVPDGGDTGIVTDVPPVSAGTAEEAASFTVEPGVNYLAKGIEEYHDREFGPAAAYLRAEVDAHPHRAYSHYLLGLALWKSDQLDEAAVAMRRSLELDPASGKAFVNLARIENDRGEFQAALEASRSALALRADDPQALFLEGRSLRNLGDREGAVQSLEHSIAIDAGNGYAQNLLGLTLLEQGDLDGAVAALMLAAASLPDTAYVHNNLGMALEHAGRPEEAIAAYRRGMALDPEDSPAARNLARLDAVTPAPAEEQVASTGTTGEPSPQPPQN
jgi:tetratricopeptide (TPR) repeat protein